MHYLRYASPLGILHIIEKDEHVVRLCLPGIAPPTSALEIQSLVLQEAKTQLDAYFDGTLRQFDLPVHVQGTPFQQRIWHALTEIPYGMTWSYKRLARHIGQSTAYRAVGMANHRNPLPIIFPCHRVIAHNGSLQGYAGGLPLKEWLLAHEKQAAIVQHDSEKSYLTC